MVSGASLVIRRLKLPVPSWKLGEGERGLEIEFSLQ